MDNFPQLVHRRSGYEAIESQARFEGPQCQVVPSRQWAYGGSEHAPGPHAGRLASVVPCYSPLLAYQCANGEVVFVERQRHDTVRELSLPCGQCIGCRLERSRRWAMRCVHEASLYDANCFVTLTYDDGHLPDKGHLSYPEFQRFMKRLRKHFAPAKVRFYMCGEYGPALARPHFHACLFGVDFDDRIYFKTMPSGEKLYTSAVLQRLWPFGFSSVGNLTFESAAYVARYCVQKVTGRAAKDHYGEKPPEFNYCSLKPGIGAGFMARWEADIYPRDRVVINGFECLPPAYYARLFRRRSAFAEQLYQDVIGPRREAAGRARFADNTPQRLHAKATVAAARVQLLRRTIE